MAAFDPLRTLGGDGSFGALERPTAFTVFTALLLTSSSCTEPRHLSRLTAVESGQCKADGGSESRGGFGEPICQFRYADAGKTCSGKEDYQGLCVSRPPDGAPMPTNIAGTLAQGHCAAEKSPFGCYAEVEGGKLIDGYQCAD